MNFTYPKKEKLCSKVIIDKLFTDQKPIYEFPLKVLWATHQLPEKVPVQSVVTVSKRRFKHAHKRNLLKRRMREAFRLNKNNLYITLESINIQIAMMIIYNHQEILKFTEIELATIKVIKKILTKINQPNAKI